MRCFFLTVIFLFSATAVCADDLTIYTENYPPYNYEEGGKVVGMSTEKLVAAIQKAGVNIDPANIELVPWARAYKAAQDSANTCVFSTTRTAERENMFAWVSPLAPTQIGLIAKADSTITISDAKDANSYKVGVIRDDVGQMLLKSAGVSTFDISKTIELLAKKLNAGRIDLVSYEVNVFKSLAKKAGMDESQFKVVHILSESELGLACHKDTDPAVLEKLRNAL